MGQPIYQDDHLVISGAGLPQIDGQTPIICLIDKEEKKLIPITKDLPSLRGFIHFLMFGQQTDLTYAAGFLGIAQYYGKGKRNLPLTFFPLEEQAYLEFFNGLMVRVIRRSEPFRLSIPDTNWRVPVVLCQVICGHPVYFLPSVYNDKIIFDVKVSPLNSAKSLISQI